VQYLKILDNIFQHVGLLNKLNRAVKTDLSFCVSGTSIGEKIASLYYLSKENKIVFVARDQIELLEIRDGLKSLNVNFEEALFDTIPPIFSVVNNNLILNQISKSLYNFKFGNAQILLLNNESILYKFHQKLNKNNYLKLEKNKNYNLQEITKILINLGYNKCQKVEKFGDFSIKGDILDIYLNNLDNSIRINFFDDEIETINYFNLDEMQKLEEINFIEIFPNKLNFLTEDNKQEIINNLKNSVLNLTLGGDALIKCHTIVNQVISLMQDNIITGDCNYTLPFLNNAYSIFDLLDTSIFILSEPKKIHDDLVDVYKSVQASIYDFCSSGELLPEHANFYFSPEQLYSIKPNIIFSITNDKFAVDLSDYARTIGARNYVFDYKSLANDLFIYERSNYKVVLFAGSNDGKASILDFLTKHNIFASDELNLKTNKFHVVVSEEYFAKSFSFLDSGIIVIGTDDLVKRTAKQVKNISNKSNKKRVFYLPKVGEYVVHQTHGIGKCIQLAKMNLNGTEKDYFVIEYAGGDKLYLPSEQADLISAYMGNAQEPKLHKIGGQQFAKIKEKVKASVSKLAVNLLEIYAQREKSKGFVYKSDDYLLNEFENAFSHEETEDQLSAIADIKKDMQSPKIMDRLICGDVGYGKTEVALRAIYKAVLSGKQVAFLCPTTILSQQHYKTAKDRFNGFMVNVAVLNRFKTKAQQEQILKEVKEGKVDVLIGTHRLLSNDVVFKDLGLLVLDEEQRFGVGDKEKIKELKQNLDVLTLSATPIPRTLNMALTGIRDISIIETPPKERIAVKTFVAEESDTLILDACKKELARGGQVLYVFNRVEHIYEQLERLKILLPEARIGVAHGQMPEKLLEQTIMQLYNHEYDILIATTLIESGINLPLANTLIVINSDMLGLGELYQLRGRIGRSDRVAYAYFTYNPSKMLTADAYRRLDAILEYTELGSGFKIAMRDLEIRGAGNILGKEQHGHLEQVGYDMYCKLLESAVKELKGERVKEIKPIKVDITISACLPNSYIQDEDERIKQYASISTIRTQTELKKQKQQLIIGYGELPKEAEALLKIAYLKNMAVSLGAKRVLVNANACKIYMYKIEEILPKTMGAAVSSRKCATLSFEDGAVVSFDMGFATINQKLDYLLQFCEESLKAE